MSDLNVIRGDATNNSDIVASEEDRNIIHLTDENGQDVPFEFLDLIRYEGRDFVVLLQLNEKGDVIVEEDGTEVVILEVEEAEDGETEDYTGVEDEDILVAVFEIFKNKLESRQ